MGKDGTSGHSCRSCKRPDSADAMVACDACNRWFHFGCVGVDSSVENRHWICLECQAEGVPSSSNVTGNRDVPQQTLLVNEPKDRSGKGTHSRTSSRRIRRTVDIPLQSQRGSVASSVRSVALEGQLVLLKEQERLQEEELRQKEELERLEFEEKQRQIDERRRHQEEESKLREAQLAKQKALREERMRLKMESIEKRQELIRQQAQSGGGSVSGISKVFDGSKVQEWLKGHGGSEDSKRKDSLNKGTTPQSRQQSSSSSSSTISKGTQRDPQASPAPASENPIVPYVRRLRELSIGDENRQ